MKTSDTNENAVWKQFQKAAKERRRNPSSLLNNYMRECLEIWADQDMDEKMRREARRSGYRKQDAVRLVRELRMKKRKQRAS